VGLSDGESRRKIDSSPGVIVHRYRLTDIVHAPPLYIIHTLLPIYTFASRSTKREVSLISHRRGDWE
jgi:hypothetical protein